ncbi:pre-mRNA-splicing factor CWC25 homolog [Megalops cyprinoides]|uniref:pre-mRNA-splicing factor CWC25 homolog n=1 Tax=Megalops cyprinoides TaxID=118141 RepID=UPI001863D77D|nr:pre-mRNA-splicing factor CWC25 homolog [Megalops cyprinoides]
MGGGDLNLKKSWHPQTLKNIERVWKAEQRHEAERKKIEELQKELREERAREEITRYAQETGTLKKKDDRLDWMYQGPGGQVSREEYLLGRPIDKQITQQYEESESGLSAQTGLLPGSIFNLTSPASTLDLATKIREDPLFAIRKREEEKKKEVLTNPVKMKKIKDMLQHNLQRKEDKKKKKKKKKDKKKKKEDRKRQKHMRRSTSSSSEEEKPRSHHREMVAPASTSHDNDVSRYGLQLPASGQYPEVRPLVLLGSHSMDEESIQHSQKSDRKTKSRYPNHSLHKERIHRRQDTNHTKFMSGDELERKRKEMMDFARQRDEERVSNVQRYRHQEEQEKERDRKGSQHAGFIHDMKLESAATSSLEDRVKRNIHSLQRTSAALEKNFMNR